MADTHCVQNHVDSFSHCHPVMACDGWTDTPARSNKHHTMHMHWSCIVLQKRHKIAYCEILIDCFHSTVIQVECRLQKKRWGWCFIWFLNFLSSMGSRHAHGSTRYACTISWHAGGITQYSVPASASPLLPLSMGIKF